MPSREKGATMQESSEPRPTREELEAMLSCSEEWAEFWEQRALALAARGERYEMPMPLSFSGGRDV
jgi:hypothetical protein